MKIIAASACLAGALLSLCSAAVAERQRERLGRGLVAVPMANGNVFLSWRLLADDPADVAFHVYGQVRDDAVVRLTPQPLWETNFLDVGANLLEDSSWFLRPVVAGQELAPSEIATRKVGDLRPCLSIPIEPPEGYHANDTSVGDLDGDGEYEFVVHMVGRGRDNSQAGATTEPILDAYHRDGRHLWRINLGRNIREGAHYTQFMVYDLDGDGRAEVACKTADGTSDGSGAVIGDAAADHRNSRGYVLDGPEFLTVFDGLTGRALATTDYVPPRGRVRDWDDDYGNRVDRFLACVAYLDGERPSLVMCRGYYTRSVLAAWDWRGGRLTRRWTFDTDDGTPGNEVYRGQGNHGISVADVDDDGRDEIIYGSCVIDDDGLGLYSTGLGHGDAMHVADIDPDRPGLEVFKANGDESNPAGIQLRDARTGEQLFGRPSRGNDGVVRACALDVDPRHPGMELWGIGGGVDGLFSCRGERITERSLRTCNMGIWWDGDPQRELLNGVRITKWNWEQQTEDLVFNAGADGCVVNNGSKSNPCLCADVLGDWREELVARSQDGRELRIYTTTIPTALRLPPLMHDPVYRLGVAWQNVSYNQPAHTSFDMSRAGRPSQ